MPNMLNRGYGYCGTISVRSSRLLRRHRRLAIGSLHEAEYPPLPWRWRHDHAGETHTQGNPSSASYDDPSCPGFTLYLDGQQVAVFEYNSAKDALELHVWTPNAKSLAVSVTVERSK